MKDLARKLIVKPGAKVDLADVDPEDTHGVKKAAAEPAFEKIRQRLSVLQYMLYAESRRAVLVVLQGIDAAGKDGSIRHVMSGLNPQGVTVTSFKAPDGEEKRHDYLWRIHRAVPEYGKIGIFNRSHYEDVLIVRVHDLVPKAVWQKRYRQINDFERMLTENGVTILKFFCISAARSNANDSRPASGIRPGTGSCHCRTSRSASTGAITLRHMRRLCGTVVRIARPGTSFPPIRNGFATM